MSDSYIYLWDANQFDNPSEYLPTSFEDAVRICQRIMTMPKAETTNPKFAQLTDYIQQVARKDSHSPDYNMHFYHANQRTAEHNHKQQNNGQFLEILRRYDLLDPIEVLSVIQQKNKKLKLVVLDSLGMLMLPSGDTYPKELKKHLKRYPIKLSKPAKEGLPKRRADFIKQHKPSIDASLAKLGYVENFDVHPHEMQPDKVADTLYYVKQTKHGFNIVYVNIHSGMDANGSYRLESGLTFYLNKTVELAKEFCRFEIDGGIGKSIFNANLVWLFLMQNITVKNDNEFQDYFSVLTNKLHSYNNVSKYTELKTLHEDEGLCAKDKEEHGFFNSRSVRTIAKVTNLLLLLKLTNDCRYEKTKDSIYNYIANVRECKNLSEWDSKQNFKDIYPKLTEAIDAIEPEPDG